MAMSSTDDMIGCLNSVRDSLLHSLGHFNMIIGGSSRVVWGLVLNSHIRTVNSSSKIMQLLGELLRVDHLIDSLTSRISHHCLMEGEVRSSASLSYIFMLYPYFNHF